MGTAARKGYVFYYLDYTFKNRVDADGHASCEYALIRGCIDVFSRG